MEKIRILVVDDSQVVRRLIVEALAHDPELEVVGTAQNGRVAMQQVIDLKPSLVTLDVEMPEMDGLATLHAMRRAGFFQPVIVVSSQSEKSVRSTLDALTEGASDFIAKPTTANRIATVALFREELIPRIKALCSTLRTATSPALLRVGSGAARPIGQSRIDVIAIAVSTGGPAALMDLLSRFPADIPAPVVVVQHMPPTFTAFLAESLSARLALRVKESQGGEVLAPGQVWLAPGDLHMEVVAKSGAIALQLQGGAPENHCRPAANVLFRAVAKVYGSHALAIVLTGMGQDGLQGCEAIHRAGGQVLVQDKETSVVWGMPGAVASAGLADEVLPLPRLGSEILRRLSIGRPVRLRSSGP